LKEKRLNGAFFMPKIRKSYHFGASPYRQNTKKVSFFLKNSSAIEKSTGDFYQPNVRH